MVNQGTGAGIPKQKTANQTLASVEELHRLEWIFQDHGTIEENPNELKKK